MSSNYISNAAQTMQMDTLLSPARVSARLRAPRAKATTARKMPRPPMPRLMSSVKRRVRPFWENVITTLGGSSITTNLAYMRLSNRRSHARTANATEADTIFGVGLMTGMTFFVTAAPAHRVRIYCASRIPLFYSNFAPYASQYGGANTANNAFGKELTSDTLAQAGRSQLMDRRVTRFATPLKCALQRSE